MNKSINQIVICCQGEKKFSMYPIDFSCYIQSSSKRAVDLIDDDSYT